MVHRLILFVVVCVSLTTGDEWIPELQWRGNLDNRESKSFDNEEASQYSPQQISSETQRTNYPDPVYTLQTPYTIERRSIRELDTPTYAFRPRSLSLKRSDQNKPVYYTKDNYSNGYKTEMLFPGNYYSISKEKSVRDDQQIQTDGKFKPQIIPLIRGRTFEKRSLNVEETPGKEQHSSQKNSQYDPDKSNIDRQQRSDVYSENPNVESVVSKFLSAIKRMNEIKDQENLFSERSLSYILGYDERDNEDDDEDLNDDELNDEEVASPSAKNKNKNKYKIKKVRKYSKYMLPLLLAYKLKYFALIPVLISGLVLLVGATGLAGFFFALFAAVMGLQKGGY